MLAEASRQAEAKQPLDSLKAADQALEAARQTNDTAGEAFAQQARGKALKDLQRTKEALAAWQEAQQIWARTGDTPEQIVAMTQVGLLCAEDNKREEERLFVQALALAKIESPRPAALAQALYDAGYEIGYQGPMPPAIQYFQTALAMREKQSLESVKVIETLNALGKAASHEGFLNADTQALDLAKGYLTRALEMEQRVAPGSSLVVETLTLLGKNDTRTTGSAIERGNDEAAARQHYIAALQIQKKLAPGGSLEEAGILEKIGGLEMVLTDLGSAHEHLAEAVTMAERLAPKSWTMLYCISDLGLVEKEEGNLSAAREHLQRALALEEERHDFLGPSLTNLGSVAADQYDFAAARDYLERALAAFTKTIPNSIGVLITLEHLASVFYNQGDLASALEYGRRALASAEEKYKDKESGIVADDLVLVGNILRDQGNFSAAAEHYHRALDMYEKLTPGSLYVADTLGNLAELERARKNTSLAMEYDLRALQVGQKSCPNSWCMAGILNDLGEMAYEQGDLNSSENYLRQAADMREKGLGPTHPDLARSLNDLALTKAASGRRSEALAMALRAENIGAQHLRVSVRTLSERQALAYEGIRASGLDLALTLAADRRNPPSARSEIFDAVIHSRALVFDELAARHRSAYGNGDPEVMQSAAQLASARTRLATLVFRGVGDMKPEAYRKLLDDARDGKEKAEQMLAKRSIAFRQEQARTQLGLKEIGASLPQDTALVAFVRYARHDLQKPRASKGTLAPVPSYAAFVLRAGKREPEFVRLGTAHEIENLLAAWRSDIARQEEANVSKAAEDTYRRTGAALRQRIWDPLLPGLGDAREVFVVPDAALHLVSLASLPVGSSQYLVETRPLIHYLSTERDLVPAQSRHGEGILVVGNPAFDQAGKLTVASNQQSAPAGAATGTTGALLRGTRSACGTFQTLHFPPLPASQQEAENIAALWKQSSAGEGAQIMRGSAVQPGSGELLQMTGSDASPEAFAQYAPGKRVLHVATHGFFLEGSCESAVQRRLDPSKRDESILPATAENPLLLSGLAFAGANRRSSAKPDETDGILTAEEIAGINLEGVDWAVLSACDTGVGEIKVGEGVFGLRRAFQVAGAKTVIMSLWPVEDKTTEQWMETLYRQHFLNGRDTVESVRAASLQILNQRRANHQSTHPFYWGAFIAAGGWR